MFRYIDETKKLRTLSKRGYVALSALFVAIVISIFVSLDKLNVTYSKALNTSIVHSSTEQLCKNIDQMEKSFRGYVLYKSPRYLQSYRFSLQDYNKQYGILKNKVGDNNEQKVALSTIGMTVKEWRDRNKEIIRTSKIPVNFSSKDTTFTNTISQNTKKIESLEIEKFQKYAQEESSAKKIVTIMAFFGSFLPLTLAFFLSRNLSILAKKVEETNTTLLDEISIKKELETRLFRSLAIQSAVQKLSPHAVILIKEDGAIVDFNPTAENMFGYSSSSVIGKDFAEMIIPAEAIEKHKATLKKLVGDDGLTSSTEQVEVIKSDKSRIRVEMHIAIINIGISQYFACFIRPLEKQIRRRNA